MRLEGVGVRKRWRSRRPGTEREEGTLKHSTQEERKGGGLGRHVLCCGLSHSVVSDSATSRTTQSMEFSRPEHWSRYPFPPRGDLSNPGIEPRSPAWQVDSLPAEPQGKSHWFGVDQTGPIRTHILQIRNWHRTAKLIKSKYRTASSHITIQGEKLPT